LSRKTRGLAFDSAHFGVVHTRVEDTPCLYCYDIFLGEDRAVRR
jgi:hypothetical protein